MKRCTECDFTFEDYEQVCDFDGTELVPIPESKSSRRKISLLSSTSLRIQRVLKSPAALAVLALAAVMLSALVIGYYDSANQDNIGPANLASSQTTPGVRTETQKSSPTRITTQRKIATASDPMPSSILKSPSERVARTKRPNPPAFTATRAATARHSTNTLKSSPPNRTAQSAKASKNLQATNRRKPQSQTASRRTSSAKFHQPNHAAPPRTASAKAHNSDVASARHKTPAGVHRDSPQPRKNDSKFVAILKKTGSILSKPFRF